MPDIGFGEIVAIIVVALLVFGPDRLPKVAADAARTLRQLRQMAASARKDLVDAAGLEEDGEMAQAVRDLRDLDPRRTMQGVLNDERPPPPVGSKTGGRAAAGPATAERTPGEVGQRPTGQPPGAAPVAPPVVAPGAAPVAPPVVAPGSVHPPVATPAPVDPPVVTTAPVTAPVDPDWT